MYVYIYIYNIYIIYICMCVHVVQHIDDHLLHWILENIQVTNRHRLIDLYHPSV